MQLGAGWDAYSTDFTDVTPFFFLNLFENDSELVLDSQHKMEWRPSPSRIRSGFRTDEAHVFLLLGI